MRLAGLALALAMAVVPAAVAQQPPTTVADFIATCR